MRDSLFDDTAARVALPVGSRTNGTVNGAAVDMAGVGNQFRTAMLLVFAGAVTDGSHTVVLQESDTGSSGWSAVGERDRQGVLAAVTSALSDTVQRQGYVGSKRFLRASVTTSGATTGGSVSALLLLTQGSGAPIT